MATGMTTGKKLIVRTSLFTGSTLAVIVGAQTLVGVDLQKAAATLQPQNNQIAESSTTVQLPTENVISTQTIISTAPNIVVLRHPSQASTSSSSAPVIQHQTAAPISIQPPNPVAVPQQTIIQQAPGQSQSSVFVPTTRSTR